MPVGSYPRIYNSPYDVCDTAGNVKEWCNDRFGSEYYSESPRENPRGPDYGDRVTRGGCWFNEVRSCRSAHRGSHSHTFSDIYLGFRIVRTVY